MFGKVQPMLCIMETSVWFDSGKRSSKLKIEPNLIHSFSQP